MPFARNVALLASRSVLGGYLAAHGAQKMFGSFGGPGIEAAAAGFEHLGLRPGAVFARVAAAAEIGGGMMMVRTWWFVCVTRDTGSSPAPTVRAWVSVLD